MCLKTTDTNKVETLREKISSSDISPKKKKELLNRLSMLKQEHEENCECQFCCSSFNDTSLFEDDAISEVERNFSNPIIPAKIMNWKPLPFLAIGAGIALLILAGRIFKSHEELESE